MAQKQEDSTEQHRKNKTRRNYLQVKQQSNGTGGKNFPDMQQGQTKPASETPPPPPTPTRYQRCHFLIPLK
jgi:hypothetical protein